MLQNFPDEERVKNAIFILEGDRTQEFKELASALGVSQSEDTWKETVVDFCLNFKECFSIFTDKSESLMSEPKQVDKCFRLMRQIGKGKSSMREVTSLQNMADIIAQEFKLIYNHTK